MNLNEFFPHRVCINLDRRRDRWARMRSRFARHGIGPVTRFPAVDGAALTPPASWPDLPGAYGCLLSHLAVVERARAEAWPSVLIFEDDAEFDPLLGERFSRYAAQLPAGWDMLLFGGIHALPLTKVSPNLIRIRHSLSTYAYAMRETIYDAFIELNRAAAAVLDENTRELQKHFECYSFMPHLAWVEDDYSDVRGERSPLWWLKESLILWGEEMDAVLRSTAAVIFHRGGGAEAARQLRHLLDYYQRMLPSVALAVVEQRGEGPRAEPRDLPPGCRHLLLDDPSPAARGRAFDLGFETFGPGRDYFIFHDSDLFLTREDIKGNLLKCREYDFATAFGEVLDLDERDTRRLLAGDLRWDYNGNYQPRGKADLCGSCCIFTGAGLRRLGGWAAAGGEGRLSQLVEGRLSVYRSPNPARRLFRR